MTRVKACGITRLEDAELAASLGAWAVGLIFWEGSPRACALEDAERIEAALRRRAEVTGVFVNAPLDHLAYVADRCRLTLLQLHGDEGPAYCAEAARRTGARVIKAARVRGPGDVEALRAFPTDFHMLDTHVEGTPGGTGTTFDWELARRHGGPAPVILSGGLDPDNVGAAVAALRPFAVDSASGTEAAPGVKDAARLEAFFRAVAAADQALEPRTAAQA
jgi:phosphoribosylanthranilate isomerase